ncbi:uncharacterized protein LOC106012166 [Aplysia californica]|uniref:Uncharacterized protein LOC106012166 n=1 Tax=Aplysia californica TaxID=6500 RepID=A0ABM1VVH5_APLCA|nr:uncharacterized protein LOC106012166 [Aplysia californica]
MRKRIITPKKRANKLTYEIAKKEKQLSLMEKKYDELKQEMIKQAKMKSQYSVKNMKRREERNVKLRMGLRQEKSRLTSLINKKETENEFLKKQLKERIQENAKLKTKMFKQRKKVRRLLKEKKAAIARARYHGRRHDTKKAEELVEEEKEAEVEIETTNTKGEFTDETRFCVMDLTGLEVATGKIGQVMEAVGSFCRVKFSQLPSRTACQRIVDEGQVLAKTFIRKKALKRSKGFGMHKDGTTRKKVKILDTSISTEEGEAYCLGWTSVVSETGQAIAEERTEKLGEVMGKSKESEKIEILKKMKYYMNDRAANEKKSNRLLDE